MKIEYACNENYPKCKGDQLGYTTFKESDGIWRCYTCSLNKRILEGARK